jgi:light-harvesting complex I chlorophyll a/b binding protein 4
MLGVAGILAQEILVPNVFWYEAGEPGNLPAPFKDTNMGGLLAWEFCLMHFVEVRRWQDYKNFGSVNDVSSVLLLWRVGWQVLPRSPWAND